MAMKGGRAQGRPVEFIYNLRARKGKKNMCLEREARAQGLVEYALIILLVALIVIIVLALLAPPIANMFSSVIPHL